ncbi:hypothetical protein BD779DRAFT_1679993 [Infundibulicybe gibba]|nr:hypothetical protein BD779DRAFT_1679993 [Infundibulicybe gibba]
MEDLPIELTQKIFLGACSPRTTFPLHRDETRLLVTHICSRWRAIALSTPILWSSFYISRTWFDEVPYASILRTWISRADQCTLSFESYDPYPQIRPSIASSIIVKIVFPVIHRCSFLRLYLDVATMCQLLMLPPNSLCALQSLEIVIRGRATPVADPIPFSTAFGPRSQLHTFELTAPRYINQPPRHLRIANFNIPWHRLTTLTLRSPSIPTYECLDTIRRCISLQQCTIDRLPPIDDLTRDRIMELSHPPTTLPSLHTLCTGFVGSGFEDNYRAFFRALRLPHLRKFQPNDSSRPTLWSLPIFQPVLGDTIQELDLSGFEFPESLPEALALVPNLEILWLGKNTHEHPGTMMRALGDGAVAPRLATLYLDFVKSPQFLLDILEARAAAAHANCDIAALSVMILHRENTSANPPDEARMTALAEVGMRIHLDTIPDNFITAFYTLFNQLGLPVPSYPVRSAPAQGEEPILVYGAGATSGQFALQLLRSTGYTHIIATASPAHHEYLRSLGATHWRRRASQGLRGTHAGDAPHKVVLGDVYYTTWLSNGDVPARMLLPLDYRSPNIAAEIVKAAGKKVTLAVDAVTAEGTLRIIAAAVSDNARVAILLPIKEGKAVTGPRGSQLLMSIPEDRNPFARGVEVVYVRTFLYDQDTYLRENLMPKVLPELLELEIIEPNRVRLLDGDVAGLKDRAEAALDMLRNNRVSGEKLVLAIGGGA